MFSVIVLAADEKLQMIFLVQIKRHKCMLRKTVSLFNLRPLHAVPFVCRLSKPMQLVLMTRMW
jgi:hypothetical protein